MGRKRITLQIVLFFLLLVLIPLQVCAEKIFTVYTVNYPLTYFARRIGGVHIDVVFPVPAGVDPAFWTPGEATVRKYQQADLILLNGAGYEKWTKKFSLPMLRSIDTSKAFRENLLKAESTVTHSHGPGGDHSHGGTAFTTWLDFSQAALQAESIYKALSRKIPGHKSEFTKNFESLQRDLLELDAQMIALSARNPGIPLIGSHPIYQYLASRYKLNLKMVMWEPDVVPEAKEWQDFQDLLKKHPAKWMIWEGKPLPESVHRLNEMGLLEQVFSPCFAVPDEGDFLSVMQQNVHNMGLIFK